MSDTMKRPKVHQPFVRRSRRSEILANLAAQITKEPIPTTGSALAALEASLLVNKKDKQDKDDKDVKDGVVDS